VEKDKKADAGPPAVEPHKGFFVCVGNACRKSMAEAIARYDAADVIEHQRGLRPMGSIAEQTRKR